MSKLKHINLNIPLEIFEEIETKGKGETQTEKLLSLIQHALGKTIEAQVKQEMQTFFCFIFVDDKEKLKEQRIKADHSGIDKNTPHYRNLKDLPCMRFPKLDCVALGEAPYCPLAACPEKKKILRETLL